MTQSLADELRDMAVTFRLAGHEEDCEMLLRAAARLTVDEAMVERAIEANRATFATEIKESLSTITRRVRMKEMQKACMRAALTAAINGAPDV